jgi:P-type conjugative transfer protein TrbJ
MMRRILTVSFVMLLLTSQPSWAQWAVEDAAALAQRTGIWLAEEAKWIESIAEQVREVEATYNVIIQQVKQYETMVQNLQRIPEGLNFVEVVSTWGTQLSRLFSSATMIGYHIDQVMTQFTELYENLGTLGTPADVIALRQRLLSGRMEASAMTVSVTSLQGNLSELYGRICALLGGSITVAGNLDIQQIQAQQNGLMQQQLQAIAAMHATHARNTAQAQAEQVTIERLQLQAIQGAMRDDTPTTFTPQGKLPRVGW